jgi:hypothetical protein
MKWVKCSFQFSELHMIALFGLHNLGNVALSYLEITWLNRLFMNKLAWKFISLYIIISQTFFLLYSTNRRVWGDSKNWDCSVVTSPSPSSCPASLSVHFLSFPFVSFPVLSCPFTSFHFISLIVLFFLRFACFLCMIFFLTTVIALIVLSIIIFVFPFRLCNCACPCLWLGLWF